jgi:Rrf2 family transcriptional regulator, nitric oxide-sensitive transcriptional repressor
VKLTSYTDYALRTLMHLAESGEQLVTISDIADKQGIARNHLTKVVHHLGQLGIVETTRGRNGGLRLGRKPEDINIGEVVRHTEQDFVVAECFEKGNLNCLYSSSCKLKGALGRAMAAFFDVLDEINLASLTFPDPSTASGKPSKPSNHILLHYRSGKQHNGGA